MARNSSNPDAEAEPPRRERLSVRSDGTPRAQRGEGATAPRRASRSVERQRVAANPERPTRLRLLWKRKRSLLRPLGLGVAAFVVLGTATLAVMAIDPAHRFTKLGDIVASMGRAGGLTVQEVVVQGRQNTPLELIRSALGVSRGDSILDFSAQGARDRLQTIAWIDSARVERILPHTIVVDIKERRPFAIWQRDGRFAVIDRAGKIISTDQLDAFGPLPLVVGQGADSSAAPLYDLLAKYPDVQKRTQAAVRVSDRRWNLLLYNGTNVLLPEGHEAPAIQRLAELQQQDQLLDRPLAAIDLRLPDKLVLRPLSETNPKDGTARENAAKDNRDSQQRRSTRG